MGKFIIECPNCSAYQMASTSFFAKKLLRCNCGKLIDVKRDRFTVRTCSNCGNTSMYDQAKGDKAICFVCKEKLVTDDSKSSIAHIHCPSCSCDLQVDKSAVSYECPLCKTKIDVQEKIKKESIQNKGYASVIKYEGANDVLIWKHPIEDFNFGSQLIVHESQEAIFFRDGQALDLFGAGRYTLATHKIPLLEKLYTLPTDGTQPFHSEVYFINLVTQTGIKWGTDSKVRMFDPASGLSVEIGACGEFSLRVINSRKLLLKLVGTTSILKNEDLVNCNPYSIKFLTGKFKGLIVSKVKSILAKVIRENNVNILELDSYLEVIAESLKEQINLIFEDYGLHIPEFYVSNILTPDDDPNFKKMKEQYAEQYLLIKDEQIKKNVAIAEQQRKIVEAQTGTQIDVIKAQAQAESYRLKVEAEAKEMQMKGYTYQQETQRQVSIEAMKNLGKSSTNIGGISSIVSDMANIGIGLGVAGQVISQAKETITPIINSTIPETKPNIGWNCSCGNKNIYSLFCPNCGQKKVTLTNEWICPKCGNKGIKTKFCPECGTRNEDDLNE